MPDAVLIFTFSPIQPFIAEARRTADLFAASQILVQLARAAGATIASHGSLVYPAAMEKDDMPNKIVALIPWENAKSIAEEVKKALLNEWERIAKTARKELEKVGPSPDDTWDKIWQRQTANLWEIYWSAASLAGRTYTAAYREAERSLAGVKRTRTFSAVEEHALKDSLSGRREALHTESQHAKAYWAVVGKDEIAARKLRPDGRECLDSIGAIKRFCELAQKPFPSTSSVAGTDFLIKARPYLSGYRQAVEKLLGNKLYKVKADQDWPYDGDLLYIDTLTQHRLEESYKVKGTLPQELLNKAREELRTTYKKADSKPSPYYALVVFDGDNMGKRINEFLEEENAEAAHKRFSACLSGFSEKVQAIAEKHESMAIYNGGDDVVALVPLAQVSLFVQALSEKFVEITECTASAGVSIAHHLYPLGEAILAARAAEREAKKIPDKASICVTVLKRSGSTTFMRSRLEEFGRYFDKITDLLREDDQKGSLSARFAYSVLQSAYTLQEVDELVQADLTRLLKRHRNKSHPEAPDPKEWANNLRNWAEKLPDKFEELGKWLVLARFIAKGGSE